MGRVDHVGPNASGPLHDSRRRLEAVLDNATVAIFLTDERQRCIYMNRAAEQLTGYSFAEVKELDRPLHDIIHHSYPDGRPFPIEECAIDRAFPERNRVRGEESFVHKDGHFYRVAFTASPVRDEASNTVGTIIEVRDVSDERAAQEALKESRQRMEGIVRSAMDAIITVDEGQRIVLFNPAAEKMFGCSAGEALGQPIGRFIPERYRAAHDQHIRRFHMKGETNRRMGALGAISGLRSNGEEFPIEASISQVTLGGERLSTVILRDITERKTSEEARGLLAREVDHRAKNALAVAQALVSLTSADSVERFALAVKGRISALARAHSLLSQSQWRGASLDQLVRDELSTYAKEGQLELGGPPVTCSADAVQSLSLMIHELATNAVKYGALSREDGRVAIGWRAEGERLLITWREDGGPAVEEPESAGFGTRLLNQVSARQLGAELAFDWRPGGLEVRIRVPGELFHVGSAPAVREHGPEFERAAAATAGPQRRILLVEDEELVALELSEELTRLGWRVVGPAATLGEARGLLGEEIDAAVLDVNLGGRPVYPIADELARRQVPFVFCTGYEMADPDGRFPGTPVIRKPASAHAVAAVLNDLIAARAN